MNRNLAILSAALALFALPASAQLGNGTNPECLDPSCGTPKVSARASEVVKTRKGCEFENFDTRPSSNLGFIKA